MTTAAVANPLDELIRIARAPSRVIVGLMSGTSLDGVDAAVCEVSGVDDSTEVELRAFQTVPFPQGLREAIEAGLETGGAEQLCRLNVRLGEVFGDAARRAAEAAGLELHEVDLIASHGQTLWHVDASREPTGHGATLQLGEGAEIAHRTGRITLCDFRPADIAAGGCGAPLVSWVDHCLFARQGPRILLNLGGIANLTVVTPHPAGVLAFDTGPGNMVIDAVAQALTGGDPPFDLDGTYSARGTVDEGLLEHLLAERYFRRKPPKTTGREHYGHAYSEALLAWDGRKEDLLATVVELTAATVADACERFVLPRLEPGLPLELIPSGGGVHNKTLMAALERRLTPLNITISPWPTESVGFSPDAKEAVAFALLANQTVQGRPSNLPAATGASTLAVLGKIVFPC